MNFYVDNMVASLLILFFCLVFFNNHFVRCKKILSEDGIFRCSGTKFGWRSTASMKYCPLQGSKSIADPQWFHPCRDFQYALISDLILS